jgi:hypothetical protein
LEFTPWSSWWVCRDEAGETRVVDLDIHAESQRLSSALRRMTPPFEIEVERLIPYRELAQGVRVVKAKKGE